MKDKVGGYDPEPTLSEWEGKRKKHKELKEKKEMRLKYEGKIGSTYIKCHYCGTSSMFNTIEWLPSGSVWFCSEECNIGDKFD